MNRNDFLKMIGQNGPFDRQSIGEISEIIDLFPYFQSGYMLLLKSLHSTDDIRFRNQLKTSSIYIADREVLYYMLCRKPSPEIIRDDIHTGAEEKAVLLNRNDSDNQQTVIESAKNSTDLIREIEKEEGIKSESDVVLSDQLAAHSILVPAEDDNDEPEGRVLILDEELEMPEENIVFMDPGFSMPDTPDLLEIENEMGSNITESESFVKTTVAERVDFSNDRDSVKQKQAELIDKFITLSPKIQPAHDKSDIPVKDISEPFTLEKGGLVTETLARIYTNQGYYSRAIDIYEKLCLKYPEKSTYFATQIEKVKEYIKK